MGLIQPEQHLQCISRKITCMQKSQSLNLASFFFTILWNWSIIKSPVWKQQPRTININHA
jgi:hypothetical protein